jgi:hypothetical protein
LTTQPDGALQLPKDLPELMHAATPRARERSRDAIPVSLEFNNYDNAPNPTMRRPEVRIFFVSPAMDTELIVTVTADGMCTSEVNRQVSWGKLPLPPLFVDLPVAVSIARKNGMKGQGGRASLRIWSPRGAPPVLAWMVGDKTVNGVTGEIIDFDVTSYIKIYNVQWEHAAEGLHALMRSAQGGVSTDTPWKWLDPYAEAVKAYCIGRATGTPAGSGKICP